jgi:hypothetical protein
MRLKITPPDTVHDIDDPEPPDFTDVPDCSICGGARILLGHLGTRAHYHCRDCGAQSSCS